MMKYATTFVAATATLLGMASATRDGHFSIMRFNGAETCKGRMDPIVSPGVTSSHVHSVFGGSGFGIDADGQKLSQSKCTNAMLKGDKSAYWTPSLYFHDKAKNTFEPVPMDYSNVYYFFERTDDELKAFPLGLSMVSGDAMTRVVPPTKGNINLNPSKGPIVPALWTCPRKDGNYDSPPSWPLDSDGSMAGVRDSVAKNQGAGFPSHDCDGLYSPLRADIHFPSCYKTSAGLKDYKNNMAWPQQIGEGSNAIYNCPPGYMHVPHIFIEVYWHTDYFADRWTPGQGEQPFVLSNGDATGFSVHADFMSGWDEKILQGIIDSHCNTAHEGLHTCPTITPDMVNYEHCKCEGKLVTEDEEPSKPLGKLAGNNLLAGWGYGLANAPKFDMGTPAAEVPSGGSPSAPDAQPSDYMKHEKPLPEIKPLPASMDNNKPAEEEKKEDAPKAQASSEQPQNYDTAKKPDEPKAEEAKPEAPPAPPAPESAPEPTPAPLAMPKKEGGACKVKTVYETTTVMVDYPEASSAPPPAARMARRHAHAHRHHGRGLGHSHHHH